MHNPSLAYTVDFSGNKKKKRETKNTRKERLEAKTEKEILETLATDEP